MTPGTLPNSVHIHDFQAFECTCCGRCCKPWAIALEDAQLSAILASNAYRTRAKEGFIPLHSERPGQGTLGDRGDDFCTFLDQENMCDLHAEVGGRLKPLGCQLYPYQAVQTPDGMYVYLSFACPPVVAGQDTDADANRHHLHEALGKYSAPLSDTDQEPYLVSLHVGVNISWPSYKQLEERILSAYDKNNPVDSLLRTVLDIVRASASPAESWPLLAQNNEDLSFPHEILTHYLAFMASAVEDIEELEERANFIHAVSHAQPVFSHRLETELPALELHRCWDGWVLDTFERYLHNLVLGKALLKTTVVSTLLATACAIVLTGLYAEAYRRARGLEKLDLDCLTDAFRIVESDMAATHKPITSGYFLALEETFLKLAELPDTP